MTKIEKVDFGKVYIDGQCYKDVVILEGKACSRNKATSKVVHGTSHILSEEEIKTLIRGKPEVIIVGTGFSDMLEVPSSVFKRLKGQGREVYVLKTPEAVKKFNELSGKKKINALFHTTC